MAVQNTSLAALLLRIENSLPNLSKSERKVAEYIRGNPRGIIDLSVAALADACGVSDPTVVRAYKKLGFSGYEDLKLTLAQATVSPDEIIHEEISAEDSVQAVRDKVFQSAVLALQFTRDMLEPETLAAAAQLLMNARKIVIFGLGGSAPVAMDLHHKLLRLGLNAAVYTDPHLQVIAMPEERFHDLRHSFAVASIESGDDIKTVQSNLGHATASFTLDVYGHVSQKMRQQSADRMEEFIQKVSG